MSITEREALNTLRPKLMEIPVNSLTYPNMPIPTYATECESLKETFLKDAAIFASRRIDTAILANKMDVAVGALRAAEIDSSVEVQARNEATTTWQEYQDEAYELRDEAEASLDFVIPENSPARKRLEDIMEGAGHNDMLLDLGKLVRLTSEFEPELAEIAFTTEMVLRLEELYTLLTDVYGKVTSDKSDQNEARILRDRAYYYCKSIEQQIKRAAKLVLRKEPELLKRYRSEYKYQQNLKRDNNN